MPNPDPSGSPDTCPRNEWLISHQEIVDRDFLLHNFLTIENSDEQNLYGARSFATCPRRWTVLIVPGFSYGFLDSSQMTDTCPSL